MPPVAVALEVEGEVEGEGRMLFGKKMVQKRALVYTGYYFLVLKI